MSKNLYIKTLGCQANEYDSFYIKNIFKKELKINIIKSEQNADILLVNTCAIRTKTENKLFSILGKWVKIKLSRPNVFLIVAGCVASKEGIKLYNKIPYIDVIVGPRSLNNFNLILKKFFKKKNPIIDLPIVNNKLYKNIHSNLEYSTSFISIMDGCNKYCTFCIVPYTRGLEIYRNIQSVIKEIISLSYNNFKEIILLGQNVNAFINNFYYKTFDFSFLLKTIFNINNIKRIKFITSHPLEFCDNLIKTYKKTTRLFNHLHLPVQSGSNKILRLMNRGYNAIEYIKKIYKLKLVRPNISISTDIIIGFPKETYNDFKNTIYIVKKIDFENLFIFIYSKRSGTLSEKLYPKIPLFIKKKRCYILKHIIRKINNSCIIGIVFNILVIGFYSIKNQNLLYGYTENNKLIFVFCCHKYIGKIIQVYITNVVNNKTFGVLIS